MDRDGIRGCDVEVGDEMLCADLHEATGVVQVSYGPRHYTGQWDGSTLRVPGLDEQARTALAAALAAPDPPSDSARIDQAIDLAVRFGGIDGGHHKAWVIDQMVRALAGERYAEIVRAACDGEDGLDEHEWDEGIAP